MDDLLNMLRNQQAQQAYRPRDAKPPLSDHDVVIQFKTSIGRIKEGMQETIIYPLVVDCKDCSGIGGTGKIACARCDGRGVLMFSQGMLQQLVPCGHCEALGYHFENPCGSCSGKGWTAEEKRCIVEIREKK